MLREYAYHYFGKEALANCYCWSRNEIIFSAVVTQSELWCGTHIFEFEKNSSGEWHIHVDSSALVLLNVN